MHITTCISNPNTIAILWEGGDTWVDPGIIRKDYTKVGIKQYDLGLKKKFDDDNDRDGKRPKSVEVQLTANGEDVLGQRIVLPKTGVPEEEQWSATFEDLDYLDEDGEKIVYSVREVKGEENGYRPQVAFDGTTFTMTNHYDPERTSVKGKKTWEGDSAAVRPASVRVELWRDGKKFQVKTVYPDSAGDWNYEFTNLYKYRDGGEKIKYEIKEDRTSAPSYNPSVSGNNIKNVYHPYGDLRISKKVNGVTDANKDKKFPFTIEFFNADGRPMVDEFSYTIYNERNEDTGHGGKITTGGTIKLKQGESALIKEIPENWTYKIEEDLSELPGFTQAEATGVEGAIKPNAIQQAKFVNDYKANTLVNLEAVKRLTGGELRTYQFTFEVWDKDGATLLRTALNGPVDKDNITHDFVGNIVSTAPVTFGAFEYTQEDDGKTFTYQIKEKVLNDKGYTYDEKTRYADVSLKDNGDGTMTPTVKYRYSQTGAPNSNPPTFENRYTAKGSVQLQAHKTLKGGELKEGQFSFELLEYSEKWEPQEPVISRAKNAADGTVVFPALEFSQKDIGTSKLYVIREVDPGIEGMSYDTHMAFVRVSVGDNHDGTLAIDAIFDVKVTCWKCGGTGKIGAAACSTCGGSGELTSTADSLEFVNSYGAGDLTIKKQLEEGSKTDDPNHPFKFRLELTNEDGEPVNDLDMSAGKLVQSSVAAKDTDGKSGGNLLSFLPEAAQAAGDFVMGLFVPEEAAAAETSEVVQKWDSTDGSWGWTFYSDGTLSMRGDIDKAGGGTPLESLGGVLVDTPGKTGIGADVKVLSFEKGSTTKTTDLAEGPWRWMDFEEKSSTGGVEPSESSLGFPNLETVDLSNLTFTYKSVNATSAFGQIGGGFGPTYVAKKVPCAARKIIFPGDQTLSLNAAANMFDGCYNLSELENINCLTTESCTSMSRMFANTAFERIDVSGFSTASCNDISFMFSNSRSLVEARLPRTLDVENLKNMERMFEECKHLTSVVFPETVTGGKSDSDGVANLAAHGMFYGCESLQSLDASVLGAVGLSDIHNMFTDCINLTSVVMPNLLPSYNGQVNIQGVFKDCSKLESVDLSPVFEDLERATWWSKDYILLNIAEAFYGCSSIGQISFPSKKKLKISGSISEMRDAFNGCQSLEQLDLTGFVNYEKDVLGEKFGNDANAFQGCGSLRRLTVPNVAFKFTDDCGLPTYLTWVMENPDGTQSPDSVIFSTNELIAQHPLQDSPETSVYVRPEMLAITYDLNGGIGSIAQQKVNAATEVRLTEVVPVRFGYKFAGWSANRNEAAQFQPGDIVPKETVDRWMRDFQGNVRLYATWEEDNNFFVGEGVYEFTIPAGYELRLEEIIPSGTRYKVSELTEDGWKLVDSSNVAGMVEYGTPQQATFTNAPIAAGDPHVVQVSLEAEKLLDGVYAGAGAFKFQAVECDASGMQLSGAAPIKGTLHEGGAVTFPVLSFEQPGTYYYGITEVAGTDKDIIYDDSAFIAQVDVAEAEGALKASVTYRKGDQDVALPRFENRHVPGSLKIVKKVTGLPADSPNDQVFSFLVKINGKPYVGPYSFNGQTFDATDGKVAASATNAALIEGLTPGSSYSIEEVEFPNGWSQSGEPKGATGTIGINQVATVEFTNEYAASGMAQISVYKSFPNGGLKDGQFSFELYEGWTGEYPDASAKPISVAANGVVDNNETIPNPDNPDGSDVPNPHVGMAQAVFEAIDYDVSGVGTHDYTVLERVPAEAVNESGKKYGTATSQEKLAGGFTYQGVAYDTTLRHVMVEVTDNGSGTLATSVAHQSNADGSAGDVFVNHPLDVDLSISKRVTNEHLSDAAAKATFDFELGLKDSTGASLKGQSYVIQRADGTTDNGFKVSDGETITLGIGDRAEFDSLPYGTQYTVEEVGKPGWTMTDHTGELSGVLDKPGSPVDIEVENTYNASGSIVFKGKKQYEGGELKEGDFYFELQDGAGTYLGQTYNRADGTFEFKPITYTLDDAGGHFTYTIREVNGGDQGIAYDDSVFTIDVDVVDKGDGTLETNATYRDNAMQPIGEDGIVFTNHKAVRLAFTGGEGVGMLGVAAVALGCAAYLIERMRKRRA